MTARLEENELLMYEFFDHPRDKLDSALSKGTWSNLEPEFLKQSSVHEWEDITIFTKRCATYV
jgi:hypothetical protein